jgi:hypothetical protein
MILRQPRQQIGHRQRGRGHHPAFGNEEIAEIGLAFADARIGAAAQTADIHPGIGARIHAHTAPLEAVRHRAMALAPSPAASPPVACGFACLPRFTAACPVSSHSCRQDATDRLKGALNDARSTG